MKNAKLDFEAVMATLEADENAGFCIACGARCDNVEPDACNYECEDCGEREVFGAEHLLLAGYIG